MCTASLQMAAIGMSPMLSSIAKEFPEASTSLVQFIMTLPALAVAVIGFVFAFLSNRIPNNILAGIGGLFGVVAGIGACFFHPSVGVLCFWSVIIGIGNGLAGSGQQTLVNKLFTKAEKPGVLGFQTSAASISAMLMTLVGGILTDIRWNLGYLVYLIAIPGMIGCFLFLPNIIKPHPRTLEKESPEAEETTPAQNSARIPVWEMVLVVLCAITVNLVWNICTTNMSMFVAEQKLGTATQAGTATTVILFVGAVVGTLFGLIFKRLRYRLIVIAFLLMAAGYTVIFFTKTYWMLILDCIFFGCAISVTMSCLTMRCFEIGGKRAAFALAFMSLGSNGGTLLAPLMTNVSAGVFGTPEVRYRYLLGAMIALLSAAVTIVCLLIKQKKARPETA